MYAFKHNIDMNIFILFRQPIFHYIYKLLPGTFQHNLHKIKNIILDVN